MSRRQTKTDNSFLNTKIKLRLDNLPDGDISVLDCFSGTGKYGIESNREQPDKNISVLGIDKRKTNKLHLQGDNIEFLSALNLSRFDVLDLDAYGVPYEQLKIIFNKGLKPGAVVFITFIQSIFGRLPVRMLRDISFSASMIRKCPTLFNRDGFDKFKLWLSLQGVEQIKHYSTSNKHYLCFFVKKFHSVNIEKTKAYPSGSKKHNILK